MSVNENQITDFRTRKKIDASVRSTMALLDNESPVFTETPNSVFQRMLKVFLGLKPLLAFLSTFGFIPQTWRAGFGVLVQLLDILAKFGPDVVLTFKAGKDL